MSNPIYENELLSLQKFILNKYLLSYYIVMGYSREFIMDDYPVKNEIRNVHAMGCYCDCKLFK